MTHLTYQDDQLARPGDMMDTDSFYNPATLEEDFKLNASMVDGVSGKLPIDTLYENTVQTDVGAPRSQLQGDPPPDDEKWWLYPHRDY